MTQCINMHKRAKIPINVEVLANDKTYVPHETRTQRNALPCTACGNRGSRKRQNRVSSGSVSGKSGRVWAFAAKLRICLAQSVRNEDGGRIAVRVGWQSGCRQTSLPGCVRKKQNGVGIGRAMCSVGRNNGQKAMKEEQGDDEQRKVIT